MTVPKRHIDGKESQGRGSQHIHSAVHIKDAPRFDVNTDDEIVQFIDRHIPCAIPKTIKTPYSIPRNHAMLKKPDVLASMDDDGDDHISCQTC